MDATKTYSRKDGAVDASKRANYTAAECSFEQNEAGRWFWTVNAEAAAIAEMPAMPPPGFGWNAAGEIVPMPAEDDSLRPSADKLWTTEPMKPAEPEPAAVETPKVEPEPSVEETLAPIVIEGHRFMICIEGDSFPQSGPEHWALEFARKLKLPLVLRDADTFEILRHVKPTSKAAARAAGKGRAVGRPAGGPQGKGISTKLAAALAEPGGYTSAELNAMTGWARGPSPSTLARIAQKAQREMETITVDGAKRLRFKPA